MAFRFDFIEGNKAVIQKQLEAGADPYLATGDVSMKQGSTFTFSLTVRNDNGTIKDLTGYAARMKIRKHPADSTVIASYTSGSEITINGANDPNVSVTVAASATAGYDWAGLAYYDLELDDQGGTPVVTRELEGFIELSQEVTY